MLFNTAVLLLSPCLTFLSLVQASSLAPNPIARIDYPSTLSMEIVRKAQSSVQSKRSLTDNLQHSDHFRLKISAFSETFYLHLKPNDDLLHPSAQIRHHGSPNADGSTRITHIEQIPRHSVLAYEGVVVHPDHSDARLREDAATLYYPSSHPAHLGWARIIVHQQGDPERGIKPSYEGAFTYRGQVYHIVNKDKYLRTKRPGDVNLLTSEASEMVIFRNSDMLGGSDGGTPALMCGHDHLSHNTDPSQSPVLRKVTPYTNWWDSPWRVFEDSATTALGKRDDVAGGTSGSNFANSIGSIAGCPTTAKVVYMGVAADCAYSNQYGSAQNATRAILNNWNTASALYKSSFNVSLGIIHIEVHNTSCPVNADPQRPWNVACGTTTLDSRLSSFSEYRGTLGDDGAGLWHLMSGCPTGAEVGVAWLGTLCNQEATGQSGSTVSGTAVSTSGATEWQVVAHEIGHNFGAIHDCTSGCSNSTACCPFSTSSCDASSQFVMNPTTASGETTFSPCSIGNICSVMQADAQNGVNTSCLADPGSANAPNLVSLQQCGNGIVESGEDCDPGANNSSPCCDASTCKFSKNAVCDPTSDACCTNSCQLAPFSQVCRPAISEGCDIAETCTGTSAKCPADSFNPNGMACGPGGLACATGHCTSISQQCATVGMSLNLTAACPSKNTKTCQISCQDPTSAGSCVVLQSQLIDGSPCGYAGTCSSGNCISGSVWNTFKAWYAQNLQIGIPVTVVVGIVGLLILWSFILFVRRCCQRRNAVGRPTIPETARRIPSWESTMAQRNGPVGAPAPIYPSQRSSRIGSNAQLLGYHDRSQSLANPSPYNSHYSDVTSGYSGYRDRRTHTQQRSAPVNWVDPTPWNGQQSRQG